MVDEAKQHGVSREAHHRLRNDGEDCQRTARVGDHVAVADRDLRLHREEERLLEGRDVGHAVARAIGTAVVLSNDLQVAQQRVHSAKERELK